MSNLADFAATEKTRIEAEKQKHREEQNLPGFLVLEEGETKITMLDAEVRDHDFGDGVRKIFRVKANETEHDFALNPRNPVYSDIVQRLAGGQREFVILRSGLKANTRMKILDKKPSSVTVPEVKDAETGEVVQEGEQ